MMKVRRLTATRFLFCSTLLAVALFGLDCARSRRRPKPLERPSIRPPARPVERAGVRAWGVTHDAVPTAGPLARARVGDLALGDGDLVIVISSVERGGVWVDAARTSDVGFDYLGGLTPVVRPSGGGATWDYAVESVEIVADDPGAPPAILSKGRFKSNPGIGIETRYGIVPTSDTVVVTTHVRNRTSETAGRLDLADRIAWGADSVFAPRNGNIYRPDHGELNLPWLCNWQDDFCLGIVGETTSIQTLFEKDAAMLVYASAELPAGGEAVYRRYLPVRGHQIQAVKEFHDRLRGAAVGRLAGIVQEAGKSIPVANCRVEIVTSDRTPGETGFKPLSWVYTGDDGRFEIALPAGRYFPMTHRAVGREAPRQARSYDIEAGKTTTISRPLQVSPKIMVRYEVRDAETGELLPCKIRFRSYPGWPPIDFGPPWKGPGTRDVFYSATGQGEINLSLGDYLMSVSRGPEYERGEVRKISVGYGRENLIKVQLKRLIRLDDHVSVDMGVRTSASPGCRVDPHDRVVAAAAEGVQCLISGDVGVVTDLGPAIERAGLSKWLTSIPGRRIVWTGAGAGAGAELLVFPCPAGTVDPAQLALEAAATTPSELLEIVRRAYPDSLIAACRPMDEERGLVSTLGYSLSEKEPYVPGGKDTAVPKGLEFDLYEAVTGGVTAVEIDRRYRRMYGRLMREVRNYGLSAGSDSRYLWGNECGYPRTYVYRTPKSGAGLFEQMRESLLSGNVLVSTGPFVRLLVNGKPPGSFVTDTDGLLNVLFEIRAAPYVSVDAGIVYEGEFFNRHIIIGPSQKLVRLPTRALASPELEVKIKHDVIIYAAAVGRFSLSPVVVEDDRLGFRGHPYALSGPVFVDADGDGKCTPPSPIQKGGDSRVF